MKRTSRNVLFDVVTIGATTRDVFVKSLHFEKRRSESPSHTWETCVPVGAKIPVDTLVFQTGGGAANSATTFARWGFRTACISRVGKDLGGTELIAQLKKEKIHTAEIQIDPKEATGYSIILLAGYGDRTILTARGASNHLNPKQIRWNALRSNWIYLTSVGEDRPMLKHVFEHAKHSRTHIAWNPGSTEIELGLKALLPHLMQSDIVSLNREEAALLADVAPRQLQAIIKKLGALPRTALIITDGDKGAFVTSRGVTWHAKALPGKQINTTGAGDAFGSGFVASLMLDGDITRALQCATVNAHAVVSHLDSKAGILSHLPTPAERKRVSITEYAA